MPTSFGTSTFKECFDALDDEHLKRVKEYLDKHGWISEIKAYNIGPPRQYVEEFYEGMPKDLKIFSDDFVHYEMDRFLSKVTTLPGVIRKVYPEEEETPEGRQFFGYSEEVIDRAHKKLLEQEGKG